MSLNAYTLHQTKTRLPDGRWVPARPIGGTAIPFMWRLREAWRVLSGNRWTVVFPGQEPEDE